MQLQSLLDGHDQEGKLSQAVSKEHVTLIIQEHNQSPTQPPHPYHLSLILGHVTLVPNGPRDLHL